VGVLQLISGPATEPLTLEETRAHLRVDVADDDALITRLIIAARQLSEEYCRRAWVAQAWKLHLDAFPDMAARGGEILLKRCPVTVVSAVEYADADGADQTLAPSLYDEDLVSEPARLLPAFGEAWPATRVKPNAVRVAFTCGYAGGAVPEIAKQAMLQSIGSWYANREGVITGTIATELPGLARSLLDAGDLRLFRFG